MTFADVFGRALENAGMKTPSAQGQQAPIDQLYVNLEAVKVLDIKVGEAYSRLLAEKANLEVQIETHAQEDASVLIRVGPRA